MNTENQQYQFEIIPKSWNKRRKPTKQPIPLSVTIPDFQLKEQHFCYMHVRYDDGSERTFYSRVIRNQISGNWTVDGMHVAVNVVFSGK